jgi:hypothetical protein
VSLSGRHGDDRADELEHDEGDAATGKEAVVRAFVHLGAPSVR